MLNRNAYTKKKTKNGKPRYNHVVRLRILSSGIEDAM